MKVLHLPTSVGGNAWCLAQGERRLGLESDVLVASQNWLQYPADIDLRLDPDASNAVKAVKLGKAFLELRNKYDIFHFNYGSSLLNSLSHGVNQLELPYYPQSAKLFVTYNGCDARQKFPTMKRTDVAPCHNAGCYGGQCNSGALDQARRAGIAKMAQYVRHMWAVTPDLLHFLPAGMASFLPYSVSWEGIEVSRPELRKKKLRILHAPTNREAKGSAFILDALDRLEKTHGEYFERVLVEKRAHREALEIYKTADLVVDQVTISWYGALAVEAMLMGKPVISGRISEDIHFVPQPMATEALKTVIAAEPGSICEVLRRCIEDRPFLEERAEASLEYARRWHDARYVAGLTKEKYETA